MKIQIQALKPSSLIQVIQKRGKVAKARNPEIKVQRVLIERVDDRGVTTTEDITDEVLIAANLLTGKFVGNTIRYNNVCQEHGSKLFDKIIGFKKYETNTSDSDGVAQSQ